MKCPNCAETLLADAISCRFCQCGISPKHFTECPACGEMIRRGAKLCRYCKESFKIGIEKGSDHFQTSTNPVEQDNYHSRLVSLTGQPIKKVPAPRPASAEIPRDAIAYSRTELDILDNIDTDEAPPLETSPSGSSAGTSNSGDSESVPFQANMPLIREREKLIFEKLQREYSNLETIDATVQENVRATIRLMVTQDEAPLTMMEKGILLQCILDEVFGFGPLGPILRDPSVADIFVNAYNDVWVERYDKFQPTSVCFENEVHLTDTINKIMLPISGVKFGPENPIADGRLPNGTRANATMSVSGPTLTLRCFMYNTISLAQHVEKGTFSLKMAAFLKDCIKAKVNILFTGPAESGKSSLLCGLATHIPKHERIISVEERSELRLKSEHWIRLESKTNIPSKHHVSQQMLVKAALNMRPNRIILGEMKGEETYDLLLALHSGLSGTLSTITAASPQEAMERLETILLSSKTVATAERAQRLISNSLQLIVHCDNLADGTRRVSEISEVLSVDGQLTLHKLFELRLGGRNQFGFLNGEFIACSSPQKIEEQFRLQKINMDPTWFN